MNRYAVGAVAGVVVVWALYEYARVQLAKTIRDKLPAELRNQVRNNVENRIPTGIVPLLGGEATSELLSRVGANLTLQYLPTLTGPRSLPPR